MLHKTTIQTLLLAILALTIAGQVCADKASRVDGYSAVELRLHGLNRSPYARVTSIGKSVEGRPVYAVVLTDPDSSGEEKTRVLLMCGQHGDEPASVRASLDFIDSFAYTRNPYYLSLLKRSVVAVVPVVNPDGYAASRRENARGVDLNRNWERPNQPETRALTELVDGFKPQVIVDGHEWTKVSPEMYNCAEYASRGPRTSLQLSAILASEGCEAVSRNGLSFATVKSHPNRDLRLAHRHFASGGIASILLETSPAYSQDIRCNAYEEFFSALLTNITFPPDSRIASDLASLDQGAPTFNAASLFHPHTSGEFYLLLGLAAIALLAARSFGSKRANSPAQSESRRLSVYQMMDTDAPTRVKLSMLKSHKLRPTDRRASSPVPCSRFQVDGLAVPQNTMLR